MVKVKNKKPDVHLVYRYEPGQTPANTKISERSIALIVPSSTFERFHNYATEGKSVALLAEQETKRLAALKKDTYNMSKSWTDTAQNIQQRRKEELLSYRKLATMEAERFVKEMEKQNALERLEVVNQAKELLLYKKPHVRCLNRAFLLSECFRELDEQVKFQASIKEIYKKVDEEYAKAVLVDVEKYNQEEQKKRDRIKQNTYANQAEIIKQIKRNEIKRKKKQEETRNIEVEDLKNMQKELNEQKAHELQVELKKKEDLNQMFLEAIKDRKEYKLQVQQDIEFQDEYLQTYKDMKQDMDRLLKEKKQTALLDKIARLEKFGRKVYKIQNNERLMLEEKEQKVVDEEEERLKIKDLKMIEEKKENKIKAHLNLKEQIKNVEEEQNKRKKEERDLKLWESLQRCKRNEFNKEWNLKQMKELRQQQQHYGKQLKLQMAIKDAERKKAAQEADPAKEMNEFMKKSSDKTLAYSEKLIEESEGVRPLYPIRKAIRQFKKEVGLIPLYDKEKYTEAPGENRRKRR